MKEDYIKKNYLYERNCEKHNFIRYIKNYDIQELWYTRISVNYTLWKRRTILKKNLFKFSIDESIKHNHSNYLPLT